MLEVYTDGATVGQNGKLGTVSQVGLGVYIKGYERTKKKGKYSKLVDGISNNEAEFKALIWALDLVLGFGVKEARFHLDSKIVVNRANGKRVEGKYKNERMDAFQKSVLNLAKKFNEIEFKWIPREDNWVADRLSKKMIKNI